MVKQNSPKDRLIDGIIMFILLMVCFVCIVPIVNTLAVSLSSSAAATSGKVFLFPVDFTLNSYSLVIKDKMFYTSFINSLKRVLLGTATQFLFSCIMAYPLSRDKKEFKARNIYMWYALFAMIFAPALIPWYLTMKDLGMRDNIWALVLPYAVPVYNMILVMNYFRSIPKELDEAAEIDGAGPWYMLLKIYIPLSKPVLATVTLFSAVSHWNTFLDGLVLMKKTSMYPLSTYIQSLVVQLNFTNISSESAEMLNKISNKTLNAAKVFIAMVPIFIIYPFIQKYFTSGIMLGSVKE